MTQQSDEYVNDQIVGEIKQALVEHWKQSAAPELKVQIRDLKQSFEDNHLERVEGVTLVGPSRGKMASLSLAVRQFLDEYLGWNSMHLQGLSIPSDYVSSSTQVRPIWLALPLSPGAVGRIWSACLETISSGDPARLEHAVSIQAILPEALNGTYLSNHVVHHMLHPYRVCAHYVDEAAPTNITGRHASDETMKYYMQSFGSLGDTCLRAVITAFGSLDHMLRLPRYE